MIARKDCIFYEKGRQAGKERAPAPGFLAFFPQKPELQKIRNVGSGACRAPPRRLISGERLLTMNDRTAIPIFRQERAVSLFFLLLLAAIALRALLPAGFMPSFTADGTYELVICSGMGEKTVRVSADGTPVEDRGAPHSGDGACAFQVTSLQKIVPLVAHIFLPLPETGRYSAPEQTRAPVFAVANVPYPARGPPSV